MFRKIENVIAEQQKSSKEKPTEIASKHESNDNEFQSFEKDVSGK